jgi:hypothetical protein
VKAITWWDALDKNAFLYGGGLLRSDYAPRPSYEALKTSISSWTTGGSTTTDSTGSVFFRGFAGDYSITAEADGYKTLKTTLHVADGANNSSILALEKGGPPPAISIQSSQELGQWTYVALAAAVIVGVSVILVMQRRRR